MKTQAGLRVTQPLAQEGLGLPATPKTGTEACDGVSLGAPRGTSPADTLISAWQPPDRETIHFCHLASLTGSSPRTLLGVPPGTARKPQPREHTGQTEPSKPAKAFAPELLRITLCS